MANNTQPITQGSMSLFEFMLKLRQNPRCLAQYFPQELTAEVLKGEPRNLSRELKGTPKEMTDFVVVYGFGESTLTHVVAVAFMTSPVDMAKPPSWASDHTKLTEVYGMTPIVLALATENFSLH